jgi:hypothetical protein
MLGNRKLILDVFCEVYDLLKPWADDEFLDFPNHEIVPGAIYLLGRHRFLENLDRIKEIAQTNQAIIFLSNPAEGSTTLAGHCIPIEDLVWNKKILLIGGGDMDARYPCLQYDSFLPKILDYDKNLLAITRSDEIYTTVNKPYKFLFLNGQPRLHRKYLIERWHHNNLIDHCIWSMLEPRLEFPNDRTITYMVERKNLLMTPRTPKYLDPKYEVDRYAHHIDSPTTDTFVKNGVFYNEWGAVYIKPEPYIDTYFSVVTETVFDYPYSFRTEKIWKPIAMGHPFIAVANAGYYRDIRNLGFRTFDGIIDESFDQIDNNQERIERIAQVIEDLCQQDLASFLEQCYNVCKYNQNHLAEMQTKVRQEFPDRFKQFITPYINE